MTQGRGESSGKFAPKPLEDLSWRGLIERVFQQLQHANCSCGQRDFPSLDALVLMKEADIVPEQISHLDDVTDQQSLEVMLPFPGN